uniref:Phospholipid/glycerol acyltransferase domain-containing protein n=1 Tax=Guillardia theta TaxID=55529 RepID=A0A7S4LZV6_GUITH
MVKVNMTVSNLSSLATLRLKACQPKIECCDENESCSSSDSYCTNYSELFERHLSDEWLSSRWLYKMVQSITVIYAKYFHNYTLEGAHHIPKDGSAMFVSLHSTHNTDIPIAALVPQRYTGRPIRCLLHSWSWWYQSIFIRLGGIAGTRKSVRQIFDSNLLAACIPGGVEEAFLHVASNGKHAYELNWTSFSGNPRRGFASLALEMGPGFKIIPCFNQNSEEMRWNPFYEIWSFLGLDYAYGRAIRRLPKGLRNFLWSSALVVWVTLGIFAIPIPVKVTGHVAEPVVVEEGDTVESLAVRIAAAVS